MKKTKNLIYGDWSSGYKEIVAMSTEELAKSAHISREQHFLVIGENFIHPYCFLQIAGKVINVGFLDVHKRDYLWYLYYQSSTGELMLRSVQVNQYKDESDQVTGMVKFNFTEEGGFVHAFTDYTKDSKGVNEILKKTCNLDISCLKVAYPDFGCYDELINKYRTFPSETGTLISTYL